MKTYSMSGWFYSKDGQQLGPVSREQLETEVQSGNISQESLIWKEGQADWLSFSKVMGDTAAVSSAPAQSAAAPYNPAVAPVSQTPVAIPSYLWQAITVTVLCCWPFGIVAIVNAAKVNGLIASNQLDAAREASEKAKKWSIITLLVGLVVVCGYIAIVATSGVFDGLQ